MQEQLNSKISILKRWINESGRIVFFGGAGTSAESGIKPFRGAGGLYEEKIRTNIPNTTELCKLAHRNGH